MRIQSRMQHAMRNALVAFVMQCASIVMGFWSRTVFVNFLNADYLGVNGLFANILTVLSFAELGIGNAIVFALYKPIADGDKSKVQALMKLYKKAYTLIGIVVFCAGVCIIPFLEYIIKDAPQISESINTIYLLFLINSSSSYFLNYRSSIIVAHQRDYVVQLRTRLFQFIRIIVQCIYLWATRDYIGYLVIQIACTILLNISISETAKKDYPYIIEKNKNNLSDTELKTVFRNVKALIVYRFGGVILNGSDNILISSLVGVKSVGFVSNYTLILDSVTNVIVGVIASITASVGNLTVVGNKAQIKEVLHQLLLICVWLYGLVAICFIVLVDEFVVFWLGNQYQVNAGVVYALAFSMYVNGVIYAAYTFRKTQGLFIQSQFVPLIVAFINIILSLWWGKLIGVAGILAATGVSRLITTIVDPWLVYNKNFKQKPYDYYIKYIVAFGMVILNAIIQINVAQWIHADNIFDFLIKSIVIFCSTNVVFALEFCWTDDFKKLMVRIKGLIRARINQ